MPRSSNRGGRNNNPQGRNQFSSGWMDTAKDKPIATAAAAAAAVGAGVFLWSRRNQISEQISNLSDQISDWTQSTGSGSEFALAGDDSAFETASSNRSQASGRSSVTGMSETGGGNASLGRRSGGSGIKNSASSRGRARSIPSTT